MTAQIIAVHGHGVVPASSPLARGDDLGLTRGDGCFDATLVVRDGTGVRILDLDAHLDRLDRSCAGLDISGQPTHVEWKVLVNNAIDAWTGREAALKLVLTRGPEHGGAVTAYCSLTEIDDAARAQRRGIRVACLSRGYPSDVFADAPWLLGGVKTLSYAVNVASKREAARRGDDDVLFVTTDGYALEGPQSSLVWLDGDTLVTTPTGATGILASITQANLWAAGRACIERLATPAEITAGGGAWMLSSVRGVSPVTHLDGVTLPLAPEVDEFIREATGFAGL